MQYIIIYNNEYYIIVYNNEYYIIIYNNETKYLYMLIDCIFMLDNVL